jgi:hypothetical protein
MPPSAFSGLAPNENVPKLLFHRLSQSSLRAQKTRQLTRTLGRSLMGGYSHEYQVLARGAELHSLDLLEMF